MPADSGKPSDRSPELRVLLRNTLVDRFSPDEFNDICFELKGYDVDCECLAGAGATMSAKARALVIHMEHRDALEVLYEMLCQRRTGICPDRGVGAESESLIAGAGASSPPKPPEEKPLTPEQWILQAGVTKWEGCFTKDMEQAMQRLANVPKELSTSDLGAEPLYAKFEDLLHGFTAYVKLIKLNDWAYEKGILSDGVEAYLARLKHNRQRRSDRDAFRLLNGFTAWLYPQVHSGSSSSLYSDLYGVCDRAFSYFNDEHGHPETVWMSRVFGAADEINVPGGIAENTIEDLDRFLSKTYNTIEAVNRLWAAEFRAFYLERLAELCIKYPEQRERYLLQAGVESVEAAGISVGAESQSFAEVFAAALYAQAGRCLKETHKNAAAAMHFLRAADLMAYEVGRVSQVAIDYYEEAISLLSPPREPDGAASTLKDRKVELGARLAKTKETALGSVVIYANQFDEVFADRLVDAFAARGVYSWLAPKIPGNTDPLTEVPPEYDGVVVVGGIRALNTGKWLNNHFGTAKSRMNEIAFADLGFETQPYSDIWLTQLEKTEPKRPVVILAGGNREDTCRAVMAFVEASNDVFKKVFEEFVNKIPTTPEPG